MTTTTVIDYVLGRLHHIGVTDIFGVPGDFAFPVQDAIVAHPISTGLAAAMNSMPPTPPTATPASAVSAPSAPPTASANSARSARWPAPMPSTCRSSTHGHAQPRHPGRPRAGPPHPGQRGVRTVPQDGRHRRRRQRDHHPGQRRVRESTPCSASPETGLCRIEHERIAVRCSPGKDWPSTDRTDPR